MGIPRLSQDLRPSAERVHLGRNASSNSSTLDQLIIDGPSLVYFVFNKLLAYTACQSPASDNGAPKYSEINEGVQYFLTDLEEHGNHVLRIYFDGGLPGSKQAVRVDRMEKLRVQLEVYRRLHLLGPGFGIPGEIRFEEALWHTSGASNGAPIPPPFMVASVIESLRDSKWKDIVEVVPGEADVFCAHAAQGAHAAILSNDSDLAVHDLGPRSSLVLLGSIEKCTGRTNKGTAISVLTLHPGSVAKKIGVPSLLRLGFERYLDPSLSIAVIRERARDNSRLETLEAEYEEFAEQYRFSQPSAQSQIHLTGLDPRTAELVADLERSAHVYLTPLLEDPTRDSSWSYGIETRQLAYSLLQWHMPTSTHQAIEEYARKGQRITSVTVAQLSQSQMEERLQQLVATLTKHIGDPRLFKEGDASAILKWHVLAAALVQKQRLALDKPSLAIAVVQSTLGLTSQPGQTRASWDETHTLANIHAVLYSLRMLKQLSEYVMLLRKHSRAAGRQLGSEIGKLKALDILFHELVETMAVMPRIQDLFFAVPDTRSEIRKLDLKARNSAIASLKSLPLPNDPGQEETYISAPSISKHDRLSVQQEKQWKTTKRKAKRAKHPKGSHGKTNLRSSANSFAVLMEG